MRIPIILGTAREGRQSEKVAIYVFGVAKAKGIETEIIDVRDYRVLETDNTGTSATAKALAEKIVPADGLIIIMPEYNHGYPGELKMTLDLLFKEYTGKPVGVCGVSNGPVGGARGVQALRLALIGMMMHPVREAVYFANVNDLFDAHDDVKNKSYDKLVIGLIDAVVKAARK